MERVFPVNNQPLEESDKVLNLINVETVAKKLVEAKNKDNRLSEEILKMVRSAKKNKTEDEDETKPKKGKVPPQLVPFIKKRKNQKDEEDVEEIEIDEDEEDENEDDDEKDEDKEKDVEEDEEDKEDDDEEDEDDEEEENYNNKKYRELSGPRVIRSRNPKRQARIRKLYFSRPSQISAKAAEMAKNSGDMELYNAILAARHDRRVAIASQIMASQQRNAELRRKLAQRNQYRMKLAQIAEHSEKMSKSKHQNEYKSPREFTAAERAAFVKVAQKFNFPMEYIESQFANTMDPEIIDNIKKVMASPLDEETKKASVSAMIKTANLDEANVNRLLRYWKEELGYQDTKWIDHLFKTKYDTQRDVEVS